MSDRTITMSVSLPGRHLEVSVEREWGDNPAFYTRQVDKALDYLKKDLYAMIEAGYGEQK